MKCVHLTYFPSHNPLLPPPLFTALVNSAGVGLVNSLGSGVPGGQSNTPNLNPPNQMDPSSIERAYAALGLTYQGNAIPPQPSQANMSSQGLQGQPGMRNLNTMGQFLTPLCVFQMIWHNTRIIHGGLLIISNPKVCRCLGSFMAIVFSFLVSLEDGCVGLK